ncbi:MAG: rnfC, partial [Steroidobacteraceae bacterium]|nr:rnfC [Steroidobacteraceae bacterium]
MASARREFPAGLVLDAHKHQALEAPIVPLPPPASVLLALDQGSGSVLEPTVVVGQDVALGATIARAIDPFGATLHASVSGRVTAIGTRESASELGECLCIELANDGRDAL